MRRGKILKIRYGLNPNSSSIATNLSYLLISATSAAILVNVLDMAIRLWLGRRRKGSTEK